MTSVTRLRAHPKCDGRLDGALMLRLKGRVAHNVAELGRCAWLAAFDVLLASSTYETLAARNGDRLACGSFERRLTRRSVGGTPSSPGLAAETASAQRVSLCGRRPCARERCERAVRAPDAGVSVELCWARARPVPINSACQYSDARHIWFL